MTTTNYEEKSICKDCGGEFYKFTMEGEWCEDCFDIGLTRDMHDMSVYSIKKEMEEADK